VARGWRTAARKSVLNRDLWERLYDLAVRHRVRWEWVRGHAGHDLNERCDRLANEAIDRFLAEEAASRSR
jgi:ribonuclease HI